MTPEEATTRVTRGAELLDQKLPGWASRIDLGALSLSSTRCCILGQLYGNYYEGVRLLWPAWDLGGNNCCDHGFNLRQTDIATFVTPAHLEDHLLRGVPLPNPYMALQDAWVMAIAERVTAKVEQPVLVACV